MTSNLNLLITLNEAYLPYLNTLLISIIRHNPSCRFTVYLLHTSVTESAIVQTKKILGEHGELVMIEATDHGLDGAPTTEQFPREMYYRRKKKMKDKK